MKQISRIYLKYVILYVRNFDYVHIKYIQNYEMYIELLLLLYRAPLLEP